MIDTFNFKVKEMYCINCVVYTYKYYYHVWTSYPIRCLCNILYKMCMLFDCRDLLESCLIVWIFWSEFCAILYVNVFILKEMLLTITEPIHYTMRQDFCRAVYQHRRRNWIPCSQAI